MATPVKHAERVGVVIAAVALALLALADCGGERQTEASAADVAAFIEVLVPLIASSGCGHLTEAAREFQANSLGNVVDFQKAAQEFQRFADEAPTEIQGDLQTFADPYSNLAEAMQAADALDGVDVTKATPETLEKLQEVSATAGVLDAGVDRQEMQQATHHIVAWMRVNCTETR